MARGTGHVRRVVVGQQTMSSRCRLVAARRTVWVACRGVAGALRRFLLCVRAAGSGTLTIRADAPPR
eukprot:6621507-Prymnesium_polylepis.1